jgi:hypothetical protein
MQALNKEKEEWKKTWTLTLKKNEKDMNSNSNLTNLSSTQIQLTSCPVQLPATKESVYWQSTTSNRKMRPSYYIIEFIHYSIKVLVYDLN